MGGEGQLYSIPGHHEGHYRRKPYPIKAMFFILTNPLISYPNAREAYQALMKLELMVVSEIFMTPTAALADIVLPPQPAQNTMPWILAGCTKTCVLSETGGPTRECWSDAKMINELAKKWAGKLFLGR